MEAGEPLPAGVCPTCVGMNRILKRSSLLLGRMPHVRGDEPILKRCGWHHKKYAPRAWG